MNRKIEAISEYSDLFVWRHPAKPGGVNVALNVLPIILWEPFTLRRSFRIIWSLSKIRKVNIVSMETYLQKNIFFFFFWLAILWCPYGKSYSTQCLEHVNIWATEPVSPFTKVYCKLAEPLNAKLPVHYGMTKKGSRTMLTFSAAFHKLGSCFS